jgi:hypothetical protein
VVGRWLVRGRDKPLSLSILCSLTRVGCIDRSDFAESLRCSLLEISNRTAGKLQPSSEYAPVVAPKPRSALIRALDWSITTVRQRYVDDRPNVLESNEPFVGP